MRRAGTERDWAGTAERGNPALSRLMLWITLRLGWPVARAILPGIALYFFATSAVTRAASRDYLARVRGGRPGAWAVFRHVHAFASAILESVFLLSGRTERFRIRIDGLEHLTAALAGGRGCVLLGAHFGSFEVLRAIGRQAPVPVRPVMFRRNAGRVRALFEALDPALAAAIIELGSPAAMLSVREAVRRGEIVGLLADRAPGEAKLVTVPFLGSPARFPTGPLLLAASLDAPILLFFGIRLGPRRYVVQFEPFAERIALPRAARCAELARLVAHYAARLEARCRAHPLNWCNFYPFWEAPRA